MAETPSDAAAARHPGGLAWPLIVGVTVCDQATKAAMVSWLPSVAGPRGHEVFENLFYLHLKRNPGVAFSLFDDHPSVLTVVTSVAVALIGWWAWTVPRGERLTRNAFGLILGGALGNLIDRYARGHVIDFLDFIFPGVLGRWHTTIFHTPHFATFNLADTAICLGMALLVGSILFHRAEPRTPE